MNAIARRERWDGYRPSPISKDDVVPWLRGRLALWAVRSFTPGTILRDLRDGRRTEITVSRW